MGLKPSPGVPQPLDSSKYILFHLRPLADADLINHFQNN